jgi:hypothetical protein
MGGGTFSISAGTSRSSASASAASVFTQLERTDCADHSTITHLAACSASWITSSNWRPGGMVRSHHTL